MKSHQSSLFRILLPAIAVLLLITVAITTAAPAATTAIADYDFSEFVRGETLTEYTKNGITMNIAVSGSSTNTAVIFDSAVPSTIPPNNNFGDPDLGSPNDQCNPAGPGVSAGNVAGPGSPGANCTPVGNMLVIAENTVDNFDNSQINLNTGGGSGAPDGLIDWPDDEADGGTITLTFEEESNPGVPIAVAVNFFELLDIEAEEADGLTMTFFSDVSCTNQIAQETATGFGDNTFEQFEFNVTGVQCMTIFFPGSGAIPRIVVSETDGLAALGDYVWVDSNRNGIQDDGVDSGVNGVTVNLLDENGNFLQSTVTANDSNGRPGWYFFGSLQPGTYIVEFIEPDNGYGGFTSQYNAGNTSLDSNADPVTGRSEQVTLVVDEVNPTIDAGLLPGGTAVGLSALTAGAAPLPFVTGLLVLLFVGLTAYALRPRAA